MGASNHSGIPAALTIAGSDSGGGAGIQADLATFASLGVHGTSAITAVTAQNPKRVVSIEAVSTSVLRDQIRSVATEFTIKAVKTGMLFNAGLIEVVADEFKKFARQNIPRIVDPVAVATSGAVLLQPGGVEMFKSKLLPRATLVTPNLAETELLAGIRVSSVEEMRIAARWIFDSYGCAALIKGGHLQDAKESIDIYFDGKEELLLSAPRLKTGKLHGTGCTYSAAIAGYIALGCPLPYAVELAKNYITQAIAQSPRIGEHTVLNHFWE